MNKKLIYLSGAITGIPEEIAMGWRRDVETSFLMRGSHVDIFNPMKHFTTKDVEDSAVTNKEIMDAEIHMLRQSDILITNLDYPDSKGTIIENAIAYERGIPIFGLNTLWDELHPWQELMLTGMFMDIDEMTMFIHDHYLNP